VLGDGRRDGLDETRAVRADQRDHQIGHRGILAARAGGAIGYR
jgi:hypothetical protein